MEDRPSKITLSVELNEDIYGCIKNFLTVHREWNLNEAINAGMSLFLLQNYSDIESIDYYKCSRHYLNLICKEEDRSSQN